MVGSPGPKIAWPRGTPEGKDLQQAITSDMSLHSIWKTKVHVTIYTDGYATGGTATRGAAMVATGGEPTDPIIIIHSYRISGPEPTSTYETGQLSQ